MNKHAPNTVKRGEVALVHEAGALKVAWEMGVITDLITGKDGEVRGVTIQVICKDKSLILGRPIEKVYPLKISNTVRDFRISENVEMKNEQIGINKNGVVDKEEKNCREEVRGGNPRPSPPAAAKARCKSQLLLDPRDQGGSMLEVVLIGYFCLCCVVLSHRLDSIVFHSHGREIEDIHRVFTRTQLLE